MPMELIRQICLVALLVERLAELWISGRNLSWSMARGGREYGHGHYPWMVALHSTMLLSMVSEWVYAPWIINEWLFGMFAGVCVAAQILRWWVILTLGRQWNTRVVVIPGARQVTTGPFRFCAHPNYLAVVIEMLFLPWFFGAFWTGILFSVLNIWMLRVRIRVEDDALRELSGRGHGPI